MPPSRRTLTTAAALALALSALAPGGAMAQDAPGADSAAAPAAAPLDPAAIPPDIRAPSAAEAAEMAEIDKRMRAALEAGDAAGAEALARDLLAREEATWGPEHPWTGGTHGFLAETYRAQGQPAAAEREDRRALEINTARLGMDHPLTLASAAWLAQDLLALGDGAGARSLAERTAARARQAGPAATMAEFWSLQVVADSATATEDDAAAAAALERIVEIVTAALGADHPTTDDWRQRYDVARSQPAGRLNAAGIAAYQAGNYAAAEPLLRQALAIRERVLGPEHPLTLISLGNLALDLGALGRAAEAEPLDRRALEIRIRVLGPEHPDTLTSLNNLASALYTLGRAAEAEPLHRQAHEIFNRVLGPEHAQTLSSLNNLAQDLNLLGRAAEAEPLDRQVLEIRTRVLGPEHPSTLTSLNNLAVTEMALGAPLAALPPARAALAGELKRLAETVSGGAGEATRGAQGREAGNAGLLLAWAGWAAAGQVASGTVPAAQADLAALPENRPAALRIEAFAAVQAAGQGGAAEAVARAAARVAAGEAGLEAVVRDWETAIARRAALDAAATKLAAAGPDADPATLAARRASLAADRAETEAAIAAARDRLAAEFPRFFELIAPPPVTVAELQGRGVDRGGDQVGDEGTGQAAGLAARPDSSPGGAQEGGPGGAPLLGASEALVLLAPPEGDFPGLVWAVSREGVAWAEIPLSQAELSDRITRLHALLKGGARTRSPQTGAASLEAAVPGVRGYDRALAFELYQALFGAPEIAAVLADKPDWVLAPQGALLSLPFAALVTAAPVGADDDPAALRASPWLGLERALAVVPSVSTLRALRRLGKDSAGPDQPFFGLGDPAFEGAPAGAAEGARGETRLAAAASFFRDATGDVASVRGLPQLPETRTEVETMAASLDAGPESYLLGAAANETRLAAVSDAGRLGQARVVLFATHGLVAGAFQGLAEPALALSPPVDGPRLIDAAPEGASLGAAVAEGARLDDGLLTASEAARLDLDADWVILSACDTAAAGAPDAEGLSGLARAFFYAGARALLVSHWPVRDDVAARLTTDAIARAGADPSLSRARAFQAAMRAILEDTSKDATGAAFAHPAAWAPFQIVGVDEEG